MGFADGHDYFEKLRREASPLFLRYADRVAMSAPGPIADLACGEGRHSALLFGMGCNVIGADINEKRLEMATEHLHHLASLDATAKRQQTYQFLQLDLEDEIWPIESESFGAALIVHYYSASVIRKALRLLRPGGMFFLETYGGHGGNWQDLPSKDFMRKLLDESGFQIELCKERNVGPIDVDAVSVRTFAVRK